VVDETVEQLGRVDVLTTTPASATAVPRRARRRTTSGRVIDIT